MTSDVILDPQAIAPPRRVSAFRRLMRHRLALLALVALVILVIGSAGAPWLAPHNPEELDISNRYAPPLSELLFVAAFVTPSLASMALMIGLTCWMEIARIVYSQILVLKSADFIAAARMIGTPSWRIILRQILPNTLAPVLVAATLNTANAILLESYISFLGYGIQPPEASWGNMLTNAQSDFQVDPWLAVFPGLAITRRPSMSPCRRRFSNSCRAWSAKRAWASS